MIKIGAKQVRNFLGYAAMVPIVISMLGSPVLAQRGRPRSTLSLLEERSELSRGTEYMSGAEPGVVLMKINLWGDVRLPGIHHIPVGTDLLTLLSYAGGPGAKAELDDIQILRQFGKKRKTFSVDATEFLESPKRANPTLKENDVIVIRRSEPLFDEHTVNTISVFGTIFSVILAGVAIGNLF